MKFLFLMIIFVSCLSCHADSANLLLNPGFEQVDGGGRPTEWYTPGGGYSVDMQVVHSGSNSMRLYNTDPSAYYLSTQSVPFEHDRIYRFSGWIKTDNVQGAGKGACICVQWIGKDGFIGGTYPTDLAIKGTNDWTYLEAVTSKIPAEATAVMFTLYMEAGMVGTAWFDDLSITPEVASEPILISYIQSHYRGLMWANEKHRAARIISRIGEPLPDGLALEDVRLYVDGILMRVDPVTGTSRACLYPKHLAFGDNYIQVCLKRIDTGKTLASRLFTLRRMRSEESRPNVYIDTYNRTIVDGEPFFPLGVYCNPVPNTAEAYADLDILASSSFNCLMNSSIKYASLSQIQTYLDSIQSHRLKCIFSLHNIFEGRLDYQAQVGPYIGEKAIVEGMVKEYGTHPALLAWFINDEMPPPYIPRLESRYRDIVRLDPDHPTWEVLCQMNSDIRLYKNTDDILGSDPYPIPGAPISMVTDYMNYTNYAADGNRGIWMVPQCMNWSVYTPGAPPMAGPTYAEMRNMTFQCLVGGAKGLVYYNYSDFKRDPLGFDQPWSYLSAVADEVKSLFPVLLTTEKPPLVSLQNPNEYIRFAAWSYSGKKVLMAVNISRDTQTATFVLPSIPVNLRRLNEVGDISMSGLNLTDSFAPIAVHLYEWQ
ncbi:MAG: hypothetical protein ACYC64_05000 [Armatimonadota bacterium]